MSSGCIIYSPHCTLYSHWCIRKGNGCIVYIHIGVGLSALLVSTTWAMPEPLLRGTSDRIGSTFYVYILTFCKTSQHGSHWQKTFAIWQYQVLSIEAIGMRYSMHEAKKPKVFLITSENYWGGVTNFSLL